MRKYLLITLISIAVLISCKTADKPDSRLLTFNLEKGKSYEFLLDWTIDQTMMERVSKINVAGTYSIKVDSDDGKIKTLTTTYERFKLGFDMAGVKAEVDTDQPIPSPTLANGETNPAYMMSQIFEGIKGKSFRMMLDKSGNIVKVEGMEELIQSMIPKGDITAEQRMQMEISLKDQFNEATIRESFVNVFNIFPSKEVKVGDSWDKSYTLEGKMAGQYNSTYVLKEIKGDDVTLDVKTNIKPVPGNEASMTGLQTGTLIVDSKTGLVEKADYRQDITIKNNDFTTVVKGVGQIAGKEK